MKQLLIILNHVITMLRDSLPQYQTPKPNDLGIPLNHELELIISFIDKYIQDFPEYYFVVNDSKKENRISDILVNHFQLCKTEQSGGFFPFDFRKNPTQPDSDKETDIGVFVMTRHQKPLPIIEFEAKRLSDSSNNKEYVCGKRGGIERFKRGYHSSHLKICGMFGYVQSKSSAEWVEKINEWINELSVNNQDKTIDWANSKEIMSRVTSFRHIDKFYSYHSRKGLDEGIELWHYLIELILPQAR